MADAILPSSLAAPGVHLIRTLSNLHYSTQPQLQAETPLGLFLPDDAATTSGSEESEEDGGAQQGTLRQARVVVFDGGAGSSTPRAGKRDRRNFLVRAGAPTPEAQLDLPLLFWKGCLLMTELG